MIKKALLLASVLCVLNQTPVKASLIFNLGFAPEEDMQVPSKSVDLDECISYRPEEDVKVGYLDYSIMGVSRDTNPASLCTLLGEPSNKNTYSVLKKYGEEDDA